MTDKEMDCRVKSLEMITPTVFQLQFDPPRKLIFKAGQFASIVIPGAGPNGRDLRRAYSIAAPPEFESPEFCIKLVEGGPGTHYLHSLKPGQTFKCFAPYGDFVFKTPTDRHACFIATGTGIAPFRSMILSEAYKSAPAKSALCLAGVREEEELLYHHELRNIPGVQLVTAVSRPTTPGFQYTGRVTDYLREHADQIEWLQTDFYLCGNGAMIDEIKALLASKGVQKPHIHQEVYYKPPKEEQKTVSETS